MPTVAIVGASAARTKYGNKAVRAYRRQGWTVYPIHPSATEIEGVPAHRSVLDAPGPIDRIAMYVPPAVGLRVLDEIVAAHPAEFWLSPGAESAELLTAAAERGLDPVMACPIVAIGADPDVL